jgi:cell volume regulation protein A
VLTRNLGLCALVVIIAEGGLTARWSGVRAVLGRTALLSTVGVVVSIGVVGLSLHWLLGLDLRLALLYGAVLSSTDAAAVFASLRRLRLRPRVAATLEAESGSNDATAVIAVLLLSTSPTDSGWWQQGLLVGYELAAGALIGVVTGWVGAVVLRRVALPATGLYPLAVVGFAVLAFSVGTIAHASGFLAVYVRGYGVAGADRHVRAARPAGLAEPAARRAGRGDRGRAGAGVPGPAGLGGAECQLVPGRPA